MDIIINEEHFRRDIRLDTYSDNSKKIRNRAQFMLRYLRTLFSSRFVLVVVPTALLGLLAFYNLHHFEFSFMEVQQNLRADTSLTKRNETLGYGKSNPARFLDNIPTLEEGQLDLNHLILVAGHAITVVEDLSHVASADDAWYLLPYQRKQGIPKELVSHIQAGVTAAAADPQSLLIFSGGQTRVQAGPKSEASAYYFVADHYRWWGKETVRSRAATEEYAVDSFLNLLYSICRFREVTGHYPSKITVVSYIFKRKRFVQIHRSALRFPAQNFNFIGVVPKDPKFNIKEASDGENQNALTPYLSDPYGCHTTVLRQKRDERNPFRRFPPYILSCPELKPLLEWCGPETFSGPLPWFAQQHNESVGKSFIRRA